MRVGIYRIVLRVIVGWVEGVMLLVFFIVTVRVVDVLYRVLQFQISAIFKISPVKNSQLVGLVIDHWVYNVQDP